MNNYIHASENTPLITFRGVVKAGMEDERLTTGDSEDEWLLGLIGFILFLSFILCSDYREVAKHSEKCNSPGCARCNQSRNIHNLQQRLHTFCATADIEKSPVGSEHKSTERVEHLLNSGFDPQGLYNSIVKESGYDVTVVPDSVTQVWILPGLVRHPFWCEDTSSLFSRIIDIKKSAEDPKLISEIWKEFNRADESASGWQTNSTPSGQWRIFSLYNQGNKNKENVALCPRTMCFLNNIKLFMHDHVFGNALFSVLESGSRIEPHAGPCNYRLRCHLPLVVPPGFQIKVGTETSTWEEGSLLIFDDSFIHEVWSNKQEIKGRVVLIFDIWDPEVSPLEKAAIKYIFD